MRKVLGLTGGIGSGKSSIARMFSRMGISVYYTDDRAKALYDESRPLRDALIQLLGPSVWVNERIDRREMARLLFGNASLLQQVEDLVYPLLLEDFQRWRAEQTSAFVVMESALLLQKPMFLELCDRVLTVSSPMEVRISRVIGRDAVSRELVLQRMDHQWSDAQRESMSDYVLVSDNEQAVLPQVVEICRQMLNESNKKQ